MKHSLIYTLKNLRGNSRVCVYAESLWGLSMNLCFPYATVYMLALGLSDMQIGITASIFMFSQTVCSLLSGILNDKFGRRLITGVFNITSWIIPCLIWAFAEGFWFFAAAALLNGTTRIVMVAWECLLIEDAEKDQITQIYTLIVLCGNVSALFAPISSIMVSRLTLVPAVRILYINAFVVMSVQTFLIYYFSRETRHGTIRKQETKDQGLYALLKGYKSVMVLILRSRGILFAAVVSVLIEIAGMINQTFWQIITNKRIGIPDHLLPLFPMLRSCMSIVFFFTIFSRINQYRLKVPLITGYLSSIIGCFILILLPRGYIGYIGLVASLIFDSLGGALLGSLRGAIVALHADPQERSRIMAILYTAVMLVSVPFGYFAGFLSEISRILPFVLNMALLSVGILSAMMFFKKFRV